MSRQLPAISRKDPRSQRRPLLAGAGRRTAGQQAPARPAPASGGDVAPDLVPASPSAGAEPARARGEPLRQRWQVLAARMAALAYLFYPADAVAQYWRGTGAAIGYVILASFAVCWLVIIPVGISSPLIPLAPARRFWLLYTVMAGLLLAELPFAHAGAFVMAVFITVTTVARFGARSAPVVLALAVAALVVPVAIPPWHVSLAAAWDDVTPVAIPVAALMTFMVHHALASTHELAQARAELASVAAEKAAASERFRIARDLHDLLGHSLTTITVKAGLAARIGHADHARAIQEMTEVEALARQSLTEVRAAVASYRQVTLAGELATGRQLLRAAGITADLPSAVDDVSPACQELFGWVLREGLTNIVRHSHARACSVRLTPSSIEITDDGGGGSAPAGNGLTGLRERVAAAGGRIDVGPLRPAGWRLRVSLPIEGHV